MPTNFPGGVMSYGIPLPSSISVPIGGTHYFVRPAVGSDGEAGTDMRAPLKTVSKALTLTTAGNNDVIHLIGNGATSGTSREDLAMTISQNGLTLIGHAAPSPFSMRARIAPNTTTVGAAGNKDYLTVSGSGNYIANIQLWAGFATGIAATIALTVTGHRNVFENCHIAGLADTASAQNTASMSLKIQGDENYFKHCVIGVDTVTRTVANTSLQFAANPTTGYGAARNLFEDCIFVFETSAATSLAIKTAAVSTLDRTNTFRRCLFLNVGAGTTTMAAVATLNASSGGFLIFDNCSRYGITDWGTDATSLAQIWVNGPGTGGTAADDVGRGAVAVAS